MDFKTQISIQEERGDFSTVLSPVGWSSRQNINREALELIDLTHQMDLPDIHRIFYSNTKKDTFYSAVYGKFSKILEHKKV